MPTVEEAANGLALEVDNYITLGMMDTMGMQRALRTYVEAKYKLPELAALRIEPWRRRIVCPKCGNRRSSLPGWACRLFDIIPAGFGIAWCAGHQQPEREIKHPVQTAGGVQTATVTVNFTCAGLTDEHIHINCAVCGFGFFMAPRSTR